jgi:hypothetical protein
MDSHTFYIIVIMIGIFSLGYFLGKNDEKRK